MGGIITEYDSLEEMFQAIAAAEKEASAKVTDEQRAAFQVGDLFFRFAQGVAIYGEIVDPTLHAEDEEEVEDLRETYNQVHMRNYRFTRCFSVMCPEGELGDTHLSTMHKISQRQFEMARGMGWPSGVATLS